MPATNAFAVDRASSLIRALAFAAFFAFAIAATGCHSSHSSADSPAAATVHISSVNFTDVAYPTPSDQPIVLSAAKNEWVSFTISVTGTQRKPLPTGARLHLSAPAQAGAAAIGSENLRVYQVLSMPIDVNRAGYVRHTGQATSTKLLPRALLPVKLHDNTLDLSALRVDAGTDAPILWVDLRIPAEAPPGAYASECQVLPPVHDDHPIATLPVRLNVYDFVLPTERHLMMVGQIAWEDLKRLYPDRFETLRPFLLSRSDPRSADAVHTIDALQALAEENRSEILFTSLEPTVKWPAGQPPVVLWDDYDSLVKPWLSGDAFADKTPLGYWPIPAPEHLFNYDPRSRRDYWTVAAAHFDQNDWLLRSAVELNASVAGRVDALEAVKISADAAEILNLNPRLRVDLPLEEDQVQFSGDQQPNMVQPQTAARLLTAGPGLVFASPLTRLAPGMPHGSRWLRTDLRGVIPYIGAGGDERDVRVWSWLADIPLPQPRPGEQYGPMQFVRWSAALPRNDNPQQPGDPDELIWFYPGSWFGVDQPVATIQLKWLRRAQQDYEYLYLARQRGDAVNPLLMARLLTKPVELSPDQKPDLIYGLMSGTADAAAWSQAMSLLAQRILLHEPGVPVDKKKELALDLETLHWLEPQERPLLLARNTNWIVERAAGQSTDPAIGLNLGIDIYNASDRTPDENSLAWSDGPPGWHWRPQPLAVPQLATYHVRRITADTRIEPTELKTADRHAAVLTFTDGYTQQQQQLKVLAPVAISNRLTGRLVIDGNLDDWSADDAILDGAMVCMFDRPTLQAQQIRMAGTTTQLYTGWADENFYIAFKLSGLFANDVRETRNWVAYQFRRAWGEDLCQVLIQPVYADGSLGPVLHVALKPNGSWVERRMDPRAYADPFVAFESAGVRYAATLDGPDWRGELAIPWKAIGDEHKGRPIALRFNVSQHKTLTGESSSWAGPIDFGRDDTFTGLLILHDPPSPGMAGPGNR